MGRNDGQRAEKAGRTPAAPPLATLLKNACCSLDERAGGRERCMERIISALFTNIPQV